MNLTKDSKVILYEMYNYYLMQRRCGKSKRESITFGSAKNIQKLLFPEMLLEDVEDYLRELGRNDFLNNFYADNTVYNCFLSDEAIVAIENLPAETLSNVAKFISIFMK